MGVVKVENSCHFQRGTRNEIAIIFSCPGNKEKEQRLPLSGATGNNFDKLLDYLKKHNNLFLEYKNRRYFRITNAWNKVESKLETGQTEGKDSDIKKPKNLERLYCEINDITDYIICFGNKAKLALNKLESEYKLAPKVIYVIHLSPLALRTKRKKIEDIGIEIINNMM